MIKQLLKAAAFFFILTTAAYAAPTRPYTEHKTYFPGTDYELNVYHVYGRQDGNTILITGGMHGDEPGGYLSADLHTGLYLEQGNLIIIPRANLKSVILSSRGAEGDMNRMFVDKPASANAAQQVVKVIVSYMQRADLFLNLHDGAGFHSPVYVNELRNPKRLGQSVIVDADEYSCDGNRAIDLKTMATAVLNNANVRIANAEHRFVYLNTKTGTSGSRFAGMQQSATWYALRHYCIPAFGIEVSKDITLEPRITYLNHAINEFMKLMDVIPENPPVYAVPAVLDYALITVNGEPLTAKNGDVIRIKRNDLVSVRHIEANYNRGVSCDILGFGNLNNLRQEIPVTHSTRIVFRKENIIFAEISVEVDSRPLTRVTEAPAQKVAADKPAANAAAEYIFYVEVDEKEIMVYPNETLTVKTGRRFKILRLEHNEQDTDLPINLRGWVPPGMPTNAGDDRGYVFVVNPADMITRWAADAKRRTFPATVHSGGKELVRFYLRIE